MRLRFPEGLHGGSTVPTNAHRTLLRNRSRRGRRPPRAETANVRRSMSFRVLPRRVHFQQADWRAAEQPGPPRQTPKRPSVRSPLCRDPGLWSTIRELRRKGSSRFFPGRELRSGDGEETHFIANGNQSHRISVRAKHSIAGCGRAIASPPAWQADKSAVCFPAIPTLPGATFLRGVVNRGVASSSGRSPR